MWYYTKSDELYHFGVRGMKWGKRKARRYTAKGERKLKKYKAKGKAAIKRGKFRDRRRQVSKSRSFGAKLATNIFAGFFANRTYNSVIAAGGSKHKARAVTAAAGTVSFFIGPIGHLAVSHLYTSSAGRKK